MLFSSPIFLYLFLPITLFLNYLAPKNIRNYILLVASLIFYAWGGIYYMLLMLFSIIINYFLGIKIGEHSNNNKKRKFYLVIAIISNLLLLGIFKYTNFLVENINELLKILHINTIPQTNIRLPIGISFFTFHAISYIMDIYRRNNEVQRKFTDLALYVSFFPQLIAGPIVKYHDVAHQLTTRSFTIEKFKSGVQRFIIGLARKVLIANYFASISDEIFSYPVNSIDTPTAWLGIIAFTIQVYYDFGGYSDMAIGLGRMFGFEFLENFNFPYISKSISEFWRRWHISLSTWFRDYLYIPLGGNRKGEFRTYMNLLFVFFVTGFWHGASWNFVIWGIYHGIIIALEKFKLLKLLSKIPNIFANVYMLIVLMLSFAIFKCNSIPESINYLKIMIGMHNFSTNIDISNYFDNEFFILLIIAILGSTTIFITIQNKYKQYIVNLNSKIVNILGISFEVISSVFLLSLVILSSIYLIANTYNPFIYFRF